MGSDQFGVQMAELAGIERDWQAAGERMAVLNGHLGQIKETIAKAAATDLAASEFAGLAGFEVAFQVLEDVKDIEQRAAKVQADKDKLGKDLAADAQKLKAVREEYRATEKKIEDELKRREHPVRPGPHPKPQPKPHPKPQPKPHPKPQPQPHPQPDPGHGPGDPGHGNGDTGIVNGPGGKHDGPHLKDRSRGDWSTHWVFGKHGWEDWDSNAHPHPQNGHGDGPQAQPILDGASDERKAMVARAMERVDRRLGYSQAAETNGYRVDCSGFVSAAWGIPPGPDGGTDTHGLEGEYAHHIAKNELKPGDALVCNESGHEHVILFGGWADKDHTRMVIMEDASHRGCVSRVVPWPYDANHDYKPIRKNGVE